MNFVKVSIAKLRKLIIAYNLAIIYHELMKWKRFIEYKLPLAFKILIIQQFMGNCLRIKSTKIFESNKVLKWKFTYFTVLENNNVGLLCCF